jgi:two-component system, NarL family, response regulator LiaR
VKRHVIIFGLVGGLLIAALQYTEYRFVVIEHSVEIYGALVAILFATFGIWLGLRITGRQETIVVREVLVAVSGVGAEPASPFAPSTVRQQSLGITARELEKVDDSEYGKFGWVIDPEGNKVELWQPPAGQ